MKVLHVIAGIDRRSGGPTYALLNILRAEQALGYENEVVTLRSDGMEPQILAQTTTHVFNPSFPARFARSREANRWLRKNVKSFDVVHIHGIWSFLSLESARICQEKGVRYVYRGHGSLDPFDLRKKYWLKQFIGHLYYKRLFRGASAFFCTADLEADYLVSYGAETSRSVVPLAVDYFPHGADRNHFRAKYEIKETDFVFLFLSRIDYKKGLDLLVPAFAQLVTDFPNCRLVIAGSDSRGYEKTIHKLVAKYRVSDRVTFTGLLAGQEKAEAFVGSDVFVLPSMNENFGVAIVEALQSGLPVLISNNVYIHREIESLNGGWVCQYSLQSLLATMRHILSDRKDYESKKQSCKTAGDFFATRNLLGMYKDFYEKVLR
jgi:glycosyltransferase involved in cell wall biosynthesis